MKLDTGIYGTFLELLLTITNPSSDAAEDPSSAQANFYVLDNTGALVSAGIGPLTLTQQDSVPGVWGGSIDISGVTVTNLIVIATATVGGVARSATKLLGSSGNTVDAELTVGAPTITATPGVVTEDAKGPAV